nr:MAG TPA: protein of unknown function DUF4719 [Caudoviricetes sp.]
MKILYYILAFAMGYFFPQIRASPQKARRAGQPCRRAYPA